MDLINAVKANNYEKVKRIADTKNVNTTDETGATPVMWAAYNGNVEVLDFLVKQGADVRKKGIMGINTDNIPKTYTNAIIAAAGEGHLETVKYLVEKAGISPDEKGDCLNDMFLSEEDIKDFDKIFEFINNAQGKEFSILRKNEWYLNLKDFSKTQKEALLIVSMNYMILRTDLLNEKIDEYAVRRIVNNRKRIDTTFVNYIIPKNNYEYIIGNGSETALLSASYYGREDAVSYLISKGADVNFKNCFGVTPLTAASAKKQCETIRILLTNGANFIQIEKKLESLKDLCKEHGIEIKDEWFKNKNE
ncbi:MAG TPA: ankyrin repeat domain-containing protein [bacterium]|nr:ankyrin repeat domain-containing protein [bacterium]